MFGLSQMNFVLIVSIVFILLLMSLGAKSTVEFFFFLAHNFGKLNTHACIHIYLSHNHTFTNLIYDIQRKNLIGDFFLVEICVG